MITTPAELSRRLRSHAAAISGDILQLRKHLDAGASGYEKYGCALAALSAGTWELLSLAMEIERGTAAPVKPQTNGPAMFGDLDGGELLGRTEFQRQQH